MRRISVLEAARFLEVLALCRAKGVSAVQVLDSAGMIRHRGTRCEDALRCLEGAIHRIETAPVGHQVKTVMDMKNMVIELLKEMQHDIEAQYRRPAELGGTAPLA